MAQRQRIDVDCNRMLQSRSLMQRPVGQLERIEPYHHVSAQAIAGMLSLSRLGMLRPGLVFDLMRFLTSGPRCHNSAA